MKERLKITLPSGTNLDTLQTLIQLKTGQQLNFMPTHDARVFKIADHVSNDILNVLINEGCEVRRVDK